MACAEVQRRNPACWRKQNVSVAPAWTASGSKHEAGGMGRGQAPGASEAVLGRVRCRQDMIQGTPSKQILYINAYIWNPEKWY